MKIDRSFLKGVPGETDMEGIVSAIIAMAGSLGLEVIAEGVEEEAQVNFLLSHGCTRCQGYLFSRPQRAAQIRAMLETGEGLEKSVEAPAPRSVRTVESSDRAVASRVERDHPLSAAS